MGDFEPSTSGMQCVKADSATIISSRSARAGYSRSMCPISPKAQVWQQLSVCVCVCATLQHPWAHPSNLGRPDLQDRKTNDMDTASWVSLELIANWKGNLAYTTQISYESMPFCRWRLGKALGKNKGRIGTPDTLCKG